MIVASLYQMPVDPFEEPTGHRPLDYWGRNLLDHFLRLLPQLLAHGRRRLRDAALDRRPGGDRAAARGGRASRARVVDFSFFPFGPLFEQNGPQIDARRGALGRLPLAFGTRT